MKNIARTARPRWLEDKSWEVLNSKTRLSPLMEVSMTKGPKVLEVAGVHGVPGVDGGRGDGMGAKLVGVSGGSGDGSGLMPIECGNGEAAMLE